VQRGLEQELKYSLRKVDYFKLLKAYRKRKTATIRQTNYYFDDPKLRLRKKRFGLRIRLIDGEKAVITLKHPARVQGGKGFSALKVRHEYEEEITLKAAKSILKGKRRLIDLDVEPVRVLKKVFSNGYLSKISPLGAIKTTRTVVPLKNRIELELDRCKMFDERFYELEVETTRPHFADKSVRAVLDFYDIPYEPLAKSKLGRFLDVWKKSR
jgi:uncharacterized protein YjbK